MRHSLFAHTVKILDFLASLFADDFTDKTLSNSSSYLLCRSPNESMNLSGLSSTLSSTRNYDPHGDDHR